VNTKFVTGTDVVVIGVLLKHGLPYHGGMFAMKSAPKFGFTIVPISCSGKFSFLLCKVPHVRLLSCKGITDMM
jgi:hypothetical protein